MRKGQLALEAVAAVTILLLTLALVITQAVSRNEQLDYLRSVELQKADCTKLEAAIASVSSASENAQIGLEIAFDANVTGNTIEFADYYCSLGAGVQSAALSKGSVLVRKEAGAVSLENY